MFPNYTPIKLLLTANSNKDQKFTFINYDYFKIIY